MSDKDDGGPAFPETRWDDKTRQEVQWMGMTLRDYFATNATTDEVQELNFRHLSRKAQEQMTGLTYPTEPQGNADRVAYQLAEFHFKCAVNAAIRFALADAMIKAREST